MKRFLNPLLILTLSLVVLLSACTAPAAAPTDEATSAPEGETPDETTDELATVKVVILPYFSFAPYYIADAEGYFAEQGIELEAVQLNDAAQAVPGLATGQIDVNAGFVNVGLFNTIAQGSDIKIVADKGYVNPDGCPNDVFIAKDPTVLAHGLQAGMTIDADGVSLDGYWLDLYLQQRDLTIDDVELVKIFAPDDIQAVKDGGVDASMISEPWVTRGLTAGDFEILFPVKDVAPGFQVGSIMYGPNLLNDNRELGTRFMVAYLKGVRAYNEGATDRNVEILSEQLQMDSAELAVMCWPSIRDNAVPNVQSIMDYQQWAADRDIVPEQVTEEQIYDPEFIDAANAELGQ
jgi:ABC-type nitrate/sulfonate/bicarbonate transport system substrate-binding protein